MTTSPLKNPRAIVWLNFTSSDGKDLGAQPVRWESVRGEFIPLEPPIPLPDSVDLFKFFYNDSDPERAGEMAAEVEAAARAAMVADQTEGTTAVGGMTVAWRAMLDPTPQPPLEVRPQPTH